MELDKPKRKSQPDVELETATEIEKKPKRKAQTVYVKPDVPKPEGYVEVHTIHRGSDIKKKGRIFVTYVSPTIAKLYQQNIRSGKRKGIIEVVA